MADRSPHGRIGNPRRVCQGRPVASLLLFLGFCSGSRRRSVCSGTFCEKAGNGREANDHSRAAGWVGSGIARRDR